MSRSAVVSLERIRAEQGLRERLEVCLATVVGRSGMALSRFLKRLVLPGLAQRPPASPPGLVSALLLSSSAFSSSSSSSSSSSPSSPSSPLSSPSLSVKGQTFSARPMFLDLQSTTPVDPRVLDAMMPLYTDMFGNPHSRTHLYGWETEDVVGLDGECPGLFFFFGIYVFFAVVVLE